VYALPEKEAVERLDEIASDYLYKDILRFEGMKKSNVIKNLLQLLALQVSSEVSYQEVGRALGISRLTVQKYIDVLEQSFVVFRLHALARNKRKEISKSVKIYFVDVGIRNSLIQNYNPLSLRKDAGALWENFCIAERIKANANQGRGVNAYFWRNYSQKEVDYVEESGGAIHGYEFKLGADRRVAVKDFTDTYHSDIHLVTPKNASEFLSLD
jgi:predicted AAA+ superfamily ATPase